MPHACVKCKTILSDQSEAILKGCECGSRIFYFIKTELPVVQVNITEGNIGQEIVELSKEKPVVIETDGPENIRVLEPGAYELDITALFKGSPVVLKTDSEVYYVKLPNPRQSVKNP